MKILILIVTVVVSLVAFVRYFEANSIFHPTREMPVTPEFIGLDFEDIYFKTEDHLLLNGWFIKSNSSRAVLLYFHGNAGNISHRLEKIVLFYNLGLNVLIMDYRGYGKSQGRPTEAGLYRDAVAAYDYLLTREDIDHQKIIDYGDSLGGAVAVDLAARRKVACLVADSSFSSSADIAKTIFPFVPSFLLKTKMDSVSKVKTLSVPKLFIHSVNDEIIPFRLGKRLFDAACAPKEFLEITGGHNTSHIDSQQKWTQGLSEFFKRLNLI